MHGQFIVEARENGSFPVKDAFEDALDSRGYILITRNDAEAPQLMVQSDTFHLGRVNHHIDFVEPERPGIIEIYAVKDIDSEHFTPDSKGVLVTSGRVVDVPFEFQLFQVLDGPDII